MLDQLRDTWRIFPKVSSTLVALIGLAACVPMQGGDDSDSDSDSADDGDDDGASDDGADGSGTSSGGTGAQGDSCNAVLTCMVECLDDACANGCYANGSDGAKQKMDALLTCLEQSMCADAECASMACGTEIAACQQDVEAPGDPDPPVTGGALPGELVGDWLGTRGSYRFEESGAYFFVGVLSSDGPCVSFDEIVFKDTGVASVTGNTLTLTAQTAQQDTTDCSGQITTKMNAAHTSQYSWSISGATLTLVGESGPIEYAKQ